MINCHFLVRCTTMQVMRIISYNGYEGGTIFVALVRICCWWKYRISIIFIPLWRWIFIFTNDLFISLLYNDKCVHMKIELNAERSVNAIKEWEKWAKSLLILRQNRTCWFLIRKFFSIISITFHFIC